MGTEQASIMGTEQASIMGTYIGQCCPAAAQGKMVFLRMVKWEKPDQETGLFISN
jgi:hypothetical protein